MTLDDIKDTIGLQTFGTLVTMLVLTILVSALCFLFILPQTADQATKLQQARQVVEQRRGDIRTLRQEYADLQTYMADYKALEKRGFLKEQNRIIARRALDQTIALSDLNDVDYEIRPAKVISEIQVDMISGAVSAGPTPQAALPVNTIAGQAPNTGYALIESEINMTIRTMDDVQIYNFIKRLTDTFQGRVTLKSLDIEPVGSLTQANYLKIGNGEAVDLIEAGVTLLWHSMVPADKAPAMTGQGGR